MFVLYYQDALSFFFLVCQTKRHASPPPGEDTFLNIENSVT